MKRKESQWEYYLRNRTARLAYQKAYDADPKHKAAKAKRMKEYRYKKRHGYHRAVLAGIGNMPILSQSERDRLFRDRGHVLLQDANARCRKFHRKWAGEHPEEAAKAEAEDQARHWRDLRLERTGKWEPFACSRRSDRD
jgi:hypothetical protein